MKHTFLEGDRGSTKSQVVTHLIEPITSFGTDNKTIQCCHCGEIFKVHRDLVSPSMLCPHCGKNPWW